ncbi:MAG: LysM peptidoglycan-binding domain-containing protein, partial [Candidatus Dormibacteraeota bacterium]|nr:LysM peptidoglycan-binding domain-containing protein [Candidatus Dormibacteraeota bacterium]
MPWAMLHMPVGATSALAGSNVPGTPVAQAQFGRAVDGIGWSMSGAMVVPALPVTPASTDKHRDIVHYSARAGETLRAVAGRYGLSVNTLLWSNPSLVDQLSAGQEVLVPPIDGVLVKLTATDTVAAL